MKIQERLKKIEAANMPALRLADVKSFSEEESGFLASVLCGLAERGATWPACHELRAMGERHSATMAAKTEAELNAEIDADCGAAAKSEYSAWPEGYVVAVMLWDVFRWTPAHWRPPGAEARLLAELADETTALAGKSKAEIRAMLNQECDRLAGKAKTKL
jgi:hypothetical protein